jgi:hypothetical protein
MKKLLLTVCVVITVLFANADVPTKKVLDAFSASFSNVKNVSWYNVANGCEASFSSNNIIYRIIYDSDGNVVQCFRYYFQKELPLHVTSKLYKKFPERHISAVVEQTDRDELSYDVTMEDEKTIVLVHVNSYGNIVGTQKWRKALP